MNIRFYATIAFTSTCLLATNGDNLIALGTVARAMGGTGIAHFTAGSSATGNPALITKSKGGEFTFGGTYLSPSVKVQTNNTGGINDLSSTSTAKQNIIPYAALTHTLENGFSVGGSIFGAAGMGTNWSEGDGALVNGSTGDVGLYGMKSNLTMLKMSAPIAYKINNLSIGLAPVLLFGTLRMGFNAPDRNGSGAPLSTSHAVDNGTSSHTAFGYELGTTYAFPNLGITLGAIYHSPIAMSYKNQLSAVSSEFGYGAAGANYATFSDKLEQPAEFGAGIDWEHNDFSLTCDYRRIQWGQAQGYKNFNWENQSVYALGMEYRRQELALRLGYNYGKNPIRISSDATPVNPTVAAQYQNTNGDTINAFNFVMFPAITERHYTIGAGYLFNRTTSADVSLIYATSPEVTASARSVGLGDVTVTNDQFAASAGLNVKF
jgi:long-chain fatty acid transport protein